MGKLKPGGSYRYCRGKERLLNCLGDPIPCMNRIKVNEDLCAECVVKEAAEEGAGTCGTRGTK